MRKIKFIVCFLLSNIICIMSVVLRKRFANQEDSDKYFYYVLNKLLYGGKDVEE